MILFKNIDYVGFLVQRLLQCFQVYMYFKPDFNKFFMIYLQTLQGKKLSSRTRTFYDLQYKFIYPIYPNYFNGLFPQTEIKQQLNNPYKCINISSYSYINIVTVYKRQTLFHKAQAHARTSQHHQFYKNMLQTPTIVKL